MSAEDIVMDFNTNWFDFEQDSGSNQRDGWSSLEASLEAMGMSDLIPFSGNGSSFFQRLQRPHSAAHDGI